MSLTERRNCGLARHWIRIFEKQLAGTSHHCALARHLREPLPTVDRRPCENNVRRLQGEVPCRHEVGEVFQQCLTRRQKNDEAEKETSP